MPARRSLLFVPGARPDRFDKAMAAGADIVCVDLEDAVAPDAKEAARGAAIAWLQRADASEPFERSVRLNGLKTAAGLADLLAVAEAAPQAGTIYLPKVDGPEELAIADAVLTEAGSPVRLAALVESVDGLEHVQAIAGATPRLDTLLFGAVDLAAELACDVAPEPLLYARSRVVHAASRAGISVLDVPVLNFRDLGALRREAEAAKAFGFSGKAVLHPDNVAIVNAVFSPTPEETDRARRIVDAFEASESGLIVIDGKLIERPVIRKMRQILDAASAAGLA